MQHLFIWSVLTKFKSTIIVLIMEMHLVNFYFNNGNNWIGSIQKYIMIEDENEKDAWLFLYA